MKLLKVVVLFAWVLFISPVFAALQLELTQSTQALLPLAVVPFAHEGIAVVPGNTQLSSVVENDLKNSGQFRVITPGLLSAHAGDPSYWKKQGADTVLTGVVTALAAHQFKVDFKLTNVFNNKVLVQKTLIVQSSGLRKLAHQVSNVVYQTLTGVHGIFLTKIAYVLSKKNKAGVLNYYLDVADMDGFNPQPLLVSTMPIMSPTWSPDGKKMAYVSFERGHAAIYLQNIATGQRSLLTHFPGINGAPSFSPDGRKLAVVLTRTGSPKIYQVGLGTQQVTLITAGYSIDTEPTWSPDGTSLLFTSGRGGSPQIYRYTLSNRQVERLTFSGDYNASAHFLPSGKSIVMMHREDGLFGIALQHLDSGQVQILTQTGYDESPSLSPNGKMVLYATRYAGRQVLAIVSTNGLVKLRLPEQAGNVQDPAWSPFLVN